MNSDRVLLATFFKESRGRLLLSSLRVVSSEKGDEFYDVDYSREYGYLFHMSGFGGSGTPDVSGIYFVSGDIQVNETPSTLVCEASRLRNKTRRLRRVPSSFNLEDGRDLLDWLERNAIDEEAVWCSSCHDWLPGMTLCSHTWWCDRTGWYSTPDDRCKCASREECRE